MPLRSPIVSLTALLSTISLAACAGGSAGPSALLPVAAPAMPGRTSQLAAPDSMVYVASRDVNAVLGFPRTAHGNATPAITIAGSKTQLSEPDALALDSKSGNIYVVNDGGQGPLSSEVLIFPKGANGNVPPQTLSGSKVPIRGSEGIALDASGEIYVSDYSARAVYVFPAGASGNTAPIRTIAGSKTLLTQPSGLAFDAAGNLWITNTQNTTAPILEFAPNANGNVAPIATIGGVHTKLGTGVFNVSIDAKGSIIVPNFTSVEVFHAGSHGDVAPAATIDGAATTLMDVLSVGSDEKSNIYVTNYEPRTGVSSLVTFGPHARGNHAPLRVISGSNADLAVPVYPSFY
ncbi:MAG: hypothetical protein JO311_03415 [Candidatus Eremiobacteraeota bacterium]|nr:hypothetical protein [Candidatus Eremiobacteraeota bacterium]